MTSKYSENIPSPGANQIAGHSIDHVTAFKRDSIRKTIECMTNLEKRLPNRYQFI